MRATNIPTGLAYIAFTLLVYSYVDELGTRIRQTQEFHRSTGTFSRTPVVRSTKTRIGFHERESVRLSWICAKR